MAPVREERTIMQKLNNLPEDERAKLPGSKRKRLQAYNRARRDEREEIKGRLFESQNCAKRETKLIFF